MSIEIACVVRQPSSRGDLVTGVGGPGWTADLDTVISQVEAGRHYYVEVASVRFRVQVQRRGPRRALGTDPDETAENELRALPSCVLQSERDGH